MISTYIVEIYLELLKHMPPKEARMGLDSFLSNRISSLIEAGTFTPEALDKAIIEELQYLKLARNKKAM